jgi:hypothetical protein
VSEQLKYEVVKNYGPFELRSYGPYVLAQVQIRGDFITAGNSAFNPLLRYITGANQQKTQMAMTAPVIQSSVEPDHHLVSFVLPEGAGSESVPVPVPTDSKVHIVHVAPHFAVARKFTGAWNFDRFVNESENLEDAVEDAIYGGELGGRVEGEPYFARYNSPFTPWFLRRNEVLLGFSPAAETGTKGN